jgi:hypothetical protein
VEGGRLATIMIVESEGIATIVSDKERGKKMDSTCSVDREKRDIDD